MDSYSEIRVVLISLLSKLTEETTRIASIVAVATDQPPTLEGELRHISLVSSPVTSSYDF